ncbi:DUF4091 domain-containing protein [Muribaculum intestinale]|uniref:DUF4091 domain-containing protein n=1 Tax=Muribaculum intestinale TaxID=1796646 RepID=UPI0025A945AC|nr:DUF4091 domain-containing protein [Muribaculum intestinale]
MKTGKSILIATAMLANAASMCAQLTWASKDIHYASDYALPNQLTTDTLIHAWRGERVGAVALIHIPQGQTAVCSAKISGQLPASASFVDYVLTDDFRNCGIHPDTLPAWRVPDIIDTQAGSVHLSGETRPVWVTVEVPRDAKPGKYKETLSVDGQQISLNISVSEMTLPKPSQQAFHLNLWQQPYSVARYGKVEPWSKEHFNLLKPYAQYLARAGQSTVSAILFYEPWGEQSNDVFLPMIETTKKADGSWSYDYRIFDRWVQFMADNGIDGIIECFTMIPWEMNFRYFDESAGEYRFLKTTTDTPEYRDLWLNFLKAFASHLKEKGWFERTMISMDERNLSDMLNAYAIIQEAEPRFKVSLAGNYHPELIDKLYSYTILLTEAYPPGTVERRREKGLVTNLYTCCSRPEPNLFSNNASADAVWIPVYCTSTGHDGYLHWSFMNWTDNPLDDSRFKLFAPGDTYFIYPEGRSSVRYERLVEGIQLSEKARLLREKFIANGDAASLDRLEKALNPIKMGIVDTRSTTAATVNYLKATIDQLSSL